MVLITVMATDIGYKVYRTITVTVSLMVFDLVSHDFEKN
jgi:hypothetical protein